MSEKKPTPKDGVYEVKKEKTKMTFYVKGGILHLPCEYFNPILLLTSGKQIITLRTGNKLQSTKSFIRAQDAIDECGKDSENAKIIREFAASQGLET